MNHERALNWSVHHLKPLRAAITAFEQDHEGPLVVEPDAVPGEYLVKRPRPIADFPEEWVFQIGDVLHAIRVALDYLAFSIVRPTTKEAIKNTAFPICRDSKTSNWGSLHTLRLPGLTGDALDVFFALQPCNKRPGGPTPLTLLDDLENIHKHRHPLVLGPTTSTRGFTLWGETNFDVINRFPPSTDAGAPVFRIKMDKPDQHPNANFMSPVRVCFDEASAGAPYPVVYTLQELHSHVRKDVFGALAKYIKP